jgi:hypothetical protein
MSAPNHKRTSFGLFFAVIRLSKTRQKNMRESITPILYVIIVIAMTLLYVDHENIELLKHPINALHSLSTAHDEADED